MSFSLKNVQAITHYAIQAKVIKQHNTAVNMNGKVSTLSYNTRIQSY